MKMTNTSETEVRQALADYQDRINAGETSGSVAQILSPVDDPNGAQGISWVSGRPALPEGYTWSISTQFSIVIQRNVTIAKIYKVEPRSMLFIRFNSYETMAESVIVEGDSDLKSELVTLYKQVFG